MIDTAAAFKAHAETVSVIANSVKQFYLRKEPYRIYHGSTNSTRQLKLQRDKMVDTSRLTNVLEVNKADKTVWVESNVPMDQLVESVLGFGLLPPVVMEFPGITVGGGFSGTSGESSSFRYGFFDRTVKSIEIVLANGDVVNASREYKSDLIHGAASSFGTLGVVTLVQLELIEAKPFVEMTYFRVNGIQDAVSRIEEETANDSVEYLDGILYSKDSGVICSGKLIDAPAPSAPVRCFTRASDPWFYLHCQKLMKSKSHVTKFIESIPIRDYLFRYDRGGFWVGRYAFRYFLTPFNRITRWALDSFMRTRVMYQALHHSGQSDQYVIQDVAIPYSHVTDFLDYLDDDFGHYPLWLCPLKQTGKNTGGPYGLTLDKRLPNAPDMLLNFGVWGPGPRGRESFIAMNRRLERKATELNGCKWLYAQTFYTQDEFWAAYPKDERDKLRLKYHAEYLPSLYDKVRIDLAANGEKRTSSWQSRLRSSLWKVWPVSGIYGLILTISGRDYLLSRRKT